MKTKINLQKLVLAAVFCSAVIALSGFYIPVGVAKCFPIAHVINVLSAVVLGPFYGVAIAFITSLIRFMMGTGTILAFPGSMVGALLCGIVYKYTKNIWLTFFGELIGTGILGALISYPIAKFLLGREAAIFGFVIPFSLSSLAGVIIAGIIVLALKRIPQVNQYLTTDK